MNTIDSIDSVDSSDSEMSPTLELALNPEAASSGQGTPNHLSPADAKAVHFSLDAGAGAMKVSKLQVSSVSSGNSSTPPPDVIAAGGPIGSTQQSPQADDGTGDGAEENRIDAAALTPKPFDISDYTEGELAAKYESGDLSAEASQKIQDHFESLFHDAVVKSVERAMLQFITQATDEIQSTLA